MSVVRHLACFFLLPVLVLWQHPSWAHSDASLFGAPAAENHLAGHDTRQAAEDPARYPASLSVDPRQLVNVVIKINARITGLGKLYQGKAVRKGEVLGEMESAELETVQNTYLGIYSNMDAVQAFSMTVNEKLIDARMNLMWRGMSDEDIHHLETSHQAVKRVRIKSPATGFIYSLNVVSDQILNTGGQMGQYTTSGTTIATLAKPDALVVETSLPAREAARIKPGQKAVLHLSDAEQGDVSLNANVQHVFAFVNPLNQRQRVRLTLSGGNLPYKRLLGGLMATVSFSGRGPNEH